MSTVRRPTSAPISRLREARRERGGIEAAGELDVRLRRGAVEGRGDRRGPVVAALLAAAEWEPAARADRAAVPVQHARLDAPDAVLVDRAVRAHHGRREAVVRVVHRGDRLVEVVHGVERGLGPEDLLALIGVRLLERWEANQTRRDVGSEAVRLATEDALAAGRHGLRPPAHHALEGGTRDERAHEHAGLERRPDHEAAEQLREPLAELFDVLARDEDARE